jgi:nucleoside phosphorylase
MKILIVYALKPEASSLINSLSMIQDMRDPEVYRSDDIYAVITGIGYERALSMCRKAIELISPDYILNAGSAGSLSDAVHKKKIYHIGQVLKEDASPIQLTACGIKSETESIRLFTSMKPLLDDNERHSFSESADCADMEGYAIALSAKINQIPCSIVKIITDTYGEKDNKSIRRTIMELSSVLNAYIVDTILPYVRSQSEK